MDNEQTVEFMTGPVRATPAAPPTPPPVPPVPPVPPTPPPGWNGHWTPAEPPTADATPAHRWRFLPRSLTGRLVTGVVVLVVIVVLSAGAGTYFALRSFLYSRLDQQLIPIAVNNATTAQAQLTDHRPTPDANALFRGNQKVWIAVLTPDGAPSTVIGANVSNTGVEVMHLSSAAAVDLVNDTDSPDTVSTTDGQQLRVSAHRITTPFGELYIVTGLPTDELTATLNRLVELELVIGASAVTLALVATALGVRFSLRHLHRVTSTAQDVAAELSPSGSGLERRVPVTDPGTEVGKLAESMNTLLSTVETQFAARLDSERRMRQFMADASHELRTPLTSIRGYAELARMQRTLGGALDGDTTADNLERIESEGTRMSRLVEDLLTLARSDQGGVPELAVVDVNELLDDVVASSRAAFPEREITCHDESGLTVVGDQDQLLRAVRNLVSNAATHTNPAGAIDVRAFGSGPGVAIQVVDQGPGLPPEEAAHVFERFWRADKARTRARGGTGLGLAIVASIVQTHGGTVQFQSTIEDGSTVTVWLPARTA